MKTVKISIESLIIVIVLVAISFNFYSQDTWVAPKSADTIKNPLKNDATAKIKGKKLFNQMCAICHGNKGKGNGMAGASLNPKPSNFWDEKVQKQTDGAIYWKLNTGRNSMASYSYLKENQKWQLVSYIKTFKKIKDLSYENNEI